MGEPVWRMPLLINGVRSFLDFKKFKMAHNFQLIFFSSHVSRFSCKFNEQGVKLLSKDGAIMPIMVYFQYNYSCSRMTAPCLDFYRKKITSCTTLAT